MEEKNKQKRKAYPKGESFRTGATQKLIAFKLDLKLLKWLKSKPNQGRYINDLIRKDMHSAWVDDEHTSELELLGDFEEF
jgi:hypothetical protein